MPAGASGNPGPAGPAGPAGATGSTGPTGAAVTGNANITWRQTGTRIGTIT
jgi:hypothetical protein